MRTFFASSTHQDSSLASGDQSLHCEMFLFVNRLSGMGELFETSLLNVTRDIGSWGSFTIGLPLPTLRTTYPLVQAGQTLNKTSNTLAPYATRVLTRIAMSISYQYDRQSARYHHFPLQAQVRKMHDRLLDQMFSTSLQLGEAMVTLPAKERLRHVRIVQVNQTACPHHAWSYTPTSLC